MHGRKHEQNDATSTSLLSHVCVMTGEEPRPTAERKTQHLRFRVKKTNEEKGLRGEREKVWTKQDHLSKSDHESGHRLLGRRCVRSTSRTPEPRVTHVLAKCRLVFVVAFLFRPGIFERFSRKLRSPRRHTIFSP